MTRRGVICRVLVYGFFLNTCQPGLQISDYAAERNDRYYSGSDRAFVADGFDLSSVGKHTATPVTDNGSRRTSLISPHFALTSNHSSPAVGDIITFVAGDTPGSQELNAIVAETVSIAGSDLELVRFQNAVTNINPVAIINDKPSAIIDRQIYAYGQENRVGTNNIDQGFSTITPTSGNPTYAFTYDFDTQNGNANEVRVIGGDSGAPSFLVGSNGQLGLVETHTFNYEYTDASGIVIKSGSVHPYVSYYLTPIQDKIATLDLM